MTAQRPPAGTGKAGRVLWKSFTSRYVLDPRELTVLAMAARQADVLADLEAALAAGELVVDGSAGQPVLNGLVGEARLARQAVARLLGALDLPAEDGQAALTAAQVRARKAANVRWATRRERMAAGGNSS